MERREQIVSDLLAMIEGLGERPALQRATAALVQRIASRPRQPLRDGRRYVELSIGFVARAASTSYGTSWTAWHAVLGLVGWSSLIAREADDLGASLRVLERGRRWGQHLAIEEEPLLALDEVARIVVARGLVEDHVAFEPPPGSVRRIGIVRSRAARCPWHDDRRPSMIVNLDEGGARGLAVCMVCSSRDGRRLSAHVARAPSGEWTARLSASTLRWWTGEEIDLDLDERPRAHAVREDAAWPETAHATREQEIDLDTSERALPGEVTTASGGILLGRLDGRGMHGSRSGGDLLDVLRRADRRSSTEREWSKAWTASARFATTGDPEDGRSYLPDRLVAVQRMGVASRRTILRAGSEVEIPDRWKPTSQEWVLLDLDHLDRGLSSRSREQVEEVVEEIRSIARDDAWLRGDYAVVETSSSGAQVWLRLRSAVDPVALSSSRFARAWLRGIARRVVDRLRAVGCGEALVDESAWGSHRFGRRPGWRLLRDGSPFRSRLVASSSEIAA